MPRTLRRMVAASAVVMGCTWQGTPVPVGGELAGLEGKWVGGYSSVESGREGTITFELMAGADSAFGDVVMAPMQYQGGPQRDGLHPTAPERRGSELLKIAFVRAAGGGVRGRLEIYEDPVTGVRLRTTFLGRLRGGEIRGTYLTTAEGGNNVVRGEWSVRKQ